MPLRIRDAIDIPAHRPPLVVKVGEINDDERKAFHTREYIITTTVANDLRRVVTSIAESADMGFPGQGIWVSGAFGTGKSHFLSFVGMLLRGEPAAWTRSIPGLSDSEPPEVLAKLQKRPVFVVPFNSLDRPDDFRLGLYDAVARELVRQGLPPVELTSFQRIIDWFERLASATPAFWQTLCQQSLIVTSEQKYRVHKSSAEGREALAREIAALFGPPVEATGGAFAVEIAEGVRRLTQHVKQHGFAAVLFLVDELTLFLINATDKTRPIVDLKALLEADGALPAWALVVRHAPLEDVVREVGKDILDNLKGRFVSWEVDVQEVDLYQVLGQRVLRRLPGQESAVEAAVADALDLLPQPQLDVLYNLYGQQPFRKAVRDLYPFHPAMVDTLVSVTHLLSRERTAISVMYDMLFDLADQPLGTLLPYHRAFDYLIGQASAAELKDQPVLQAAQVIVRDKVPPVLQDAYLGNPDRVAKGLAVAETIVLGQLTDKGVPLQKQITPPVIAALNAAVLNAQVAILAQHQLDDTLRLLCERLLGTFKREGDAVLVELSLGLDPAVELRKVTADIAESRRKLLLELFNGLFGTDKAKGQSKLDAKWRGTRRSGAVLAVEATATNLPQPETKPEFAIWISFPRFAGDLQPPAPPKNGLPGALWVPLEASDDVRQKLDDLARILYLTDTQAGKAYIAEKYAGEEGRHLTSAWAAAAFQLRDALQSALVPLYRQGAVTASLDTVSGVSGGPTLLDAVKDLAGRLLDARFRQHPEFTADVTPQALESLYQAFIKGDGRVGPDAGAPHLYAGHYGLPLRAVRPSGTAYLLDLGTSPYFQAIAGALAAGEGASLPDVEKKLAAEFGLQSFVTDFLARLGVVYRDWRVVRQNKPLAIDDPANFSVQSNDVLMVGERVSQAEWASFSAYYQAVGAGGAPAEPSVRHQDAA